MKKMLSSSGTGHSDGKKKNSIYIILSYNSLPHHPEGTKQRSYFLCSDLTITIFLSTPWLRWLLTNQLAQRPRFYPRPFCTRAVMWRKWH